MDQLDKQIFSPEEIKIVNQKDVRKEVKHLGKIKMHKGQKLFDLDMKTGMIKEAELQEVLNIKGEKKRKLIAKPEHLYAPAINLENAERKFLKMIP